MNKLVCYCATHHKVVDWYTIKEHKYCVIIRNVVREEVE